MSGTTPPRALQVNPHALRFSRYVMVLTDDAGELQGLLIDDKAYRVLPRGNMRLRLREWACRTLFEYTPSPLQKLLDPDPDPAA